VGKVGVLLVAADANCAPFAFTRWAAALADNFLLQQWLDVQNVLAFSLKAKLKFLQS
jgi:hypothetical protein